MDLYDSSFRRCAQLWKTTQTKNASRARVGRELAAVDRLERVRAVIQGVFNGGWTHSYRVRDHGVVCHAPQGREWYHIIDEFEIVGFYKWEIIRVRLKQSRIFNTMVSLAAEPRPSHCDDVECCSTSWSVCANVHTYIVCGTCTCFVASAFVTDNFVLVMVFLCLVCIEFVVCILLLTLFFAAWPGRPMENMDQPEVHVVCQYV